MKRHEHVFRPLKGFQFKIKLIWRPSKSACLAAYYKDTTTKPKIDLWGFCTGKEEGRRLANIHFSPHQFSLSLAAHEAAHAALHFVRRTELRFMKNKDAEEVFAEIIEAVVAEVQAHTPKGYGPKSK